MSRKSLLIFTLLFVFQKLSFADNSNPQYTGFYTVYSLYPNKFYRKIDFSGHEDEDSCFINELIDKSTDYKHKVRFDSKNFGALIDFTKALDVLPYFSRQHSPGDFKYCTFNRIEKSEVSWIHVIMPGTESQLFENAKKTPLYESFYNCYTDDLPNSPFEESLLLYPIYQCPKGYTSSNFQKGCIKNEMHICPGDVLGRDLDLNKNWPYFIKEQGHVGIVILNDNYDPPLMRVVEMDGIESNIQQIQIETFKETVKNGFWGTKYGTILHPNLSVREYLQIKKLYDELHEEGVEYTLGWQYHRGIKKKMYMIHPKTFEPVVREEFMPGVFRCDSLIKYLYEEGAGVKLDIDNFFSPKLLFQSLQYPRDYLIKYYSSYSRFLIKSSFKRVGCSANFDDLESDIKELLPKQTYQSMYKLDVCLNKYVKFENHYNEKVNFLWNQYLSQTDIIPKRQLLERLRDLHPLTIADKILKEYDSNQNDPIHTILSEVLIYCIVFDDEYSAMSISEKDKENILKIYKIFGISKKDFEKKPSKESLIKKKYRN